MHDSVRMTILLSITFCQRGGIYVFPCSFAKTKDEIEHPWVISSHGELLEVLSSNFYILCSTLCSPSREYFGAVSAL